MAHPTSKELIDHAGRAWRARGKRFPEPLEFLRENDRCRIIAASSFADGSMLANIVIACFTPVEVARCMTHHDWRGRLPLGIKPGALIARLAADWTFHRVCEFKTKLQECQTCTSQKSVDDDDNVDDDDDEAQPMKGNDEELTEPGSSYLS